MIMGKRAEAVSIIGGADGPTSVFIVGKEKGKRKRNLKQRIRAFFYERKKKRAEKIITANPHTLQEVTAYIINQYGGVELLGDERIVREEKNSLKTVLVLEHRSDLLGVLAKLDRPKEHTVEAVTEFMHQVRLREEAAEQISEEEFPMDFHVYEMRLFEGTLRVSIETVWEKFSVSYSSSSKTNMKKLRNIAKELYCYYGVAETDISLRSERYLALRQILCE